MKEWWYKIKNFFRNLYIYRKILTTDYQFDYGYLLDLEKFKLQLMLKSFKDVSHVDHTSNIRWISICIKLIDIIQEEDSALEVVEMEMSKPQFKLVKFELKKIYLLSKKKYIQVCKEGNICFSKKRLPCCFQYSSDCSFYPCPSRVYTY